MISSSKNDIENSIIQHTSFSYLKKLTNIKIVCKHTSHQTDINIHFHNSTHAINAPYRYQNSCTNKEYSPKMDSRVGSILIKRAMSKCTCAYVCCAKTENWSRCMWSNGLSIKVHACLGK